MLKNIISYILIYVCIIGCNGGSPSSWNDNDSCIENCYLTIEAPSLEVDENGYYHMEFLDGYTQTFSTLRAEAGIEYQKLGWISNKEILIGGSWINLVNGVSYTNEDGVGNTVLSAWTEFIGDTIKVYCGYWTQDDCHTHYVDSLEVILEDLE